MRDDYACMYGDVVVTYYDDALMYDDGYTKRIALSHPIVN